MMARCDRSNACWKDVSAPEHLSSECSCTLTKRMLHQSIFDARRHCMSPTTNTPDCHFRFALAHCAFTSARPISHSCWHINYSHSLICHLHDSLTIPGSHSQLHNNASHHIQKGRYELAFQRHGFTSERRTRPRCSTSSVPISPTASRTTHHGL